MIKKLLPIVALAFLMANCAKDETPLQNLSNKDQMNQLVISDPLVWNSLAKQVLKIDTTATGLKAGNSINKPVLYPEKGYYYALFEDLYPSQGDYDFNDVILQTQLYLDAVKGEIFGNINTTVYHRGGSLNTRIGLMFYSIREDNVYLRIDNKRILINGEPIKSEDPFIMDLPKQGTNFELKYNVENNEGDISQIWIAWYIIVDSNKESREIHTSGFPVAKNTKFEIPQRDFLTSNNLPWGLEIEAEKFFVPAEKALFLNAFPEFQAWSESGGLKYETWFNNPNYKYIQ